MRKISINNDMMIKAELRYVEDQRFLDYYLYSLRTDKVYAFRRKYSKSAYSLCKNGMEVNRLRVLKTDNKAIMLLVNNLNRSLPYLADYYELSA